MSNSQENFDVPSQSNPTLKKMNIFLLIFLVVITLGLYVPVWFLRQRDPLNNLKSDEKLGSGIFILIAVFQVIRLIFDFLAGVLEGFFETALTEELMTTDLGSPPSPETIELLHYSDLLTSVSLILGLSLWIILLYQALKVRRIIIDHLESYLKKDLPFSWVATFFFNIFYLQYKINRL